MARGCKCLFLKLKKQVMIKKNWTLYVKNTSNDDGYHNIGKTLSNLG